MPTPDEITQALGLRRPFDSYAPRTQRRYRAAYRDGQTAQDVNRREYGKRSDVAARRLGAELRNRGADSNGSHDPDRLKELRDYLGSWSKVEQLLSLQLNATVGYVATGTTVGGQALKGSAEDLLPEDWYDREVIIDLAPYTKYHGRS